MGGKRWLLIWRLAAENNLITSENTIFCRMVSVIGSGFQCRIDAFDSTLYCYSDPAVEIHLNALESIKTQ